MDTLWKALEKDPRDFNAWTALASGADNRPDDIQLARKVFGGLLEEYPLCFGYWIKWFIREHALDKSEAENILERGVQAAPYCHQLWEYYVSVYLTTGSGHSVEQTRELFERAIQHVGLDFYSDKLWTEYIRYEKEILAQECSGKESFKYIMNIYSRVLCIPLSSLQTIYNEYKQYIQSVPYVDKCQLETNETAFQNTCIQIDMRRKYETGIKRHYFHVQALSEEDISYWAEYTDLMEILYSRDPSMLDHTIQVYERFLIAASLDHKAWQKYSAFLQSANLYDQTRTLLQRGATVHLRTQPELSVTLAALEELLGNVALAQQWYEYAVSLDSSSVNAYVSLLHFHRRNGMGNEQLSAMCRGFLERFDDGVIVVKLLIEYERVCQDSSQVMEMYLRFTKKCKENPDFWKCFLLYSSKVSFESLEETISQCLSETTSSTKVPWDFIYALVSTHPNIKYINQIETKRRKHQLSNLAQQLLP